MLTVNGNYMNGIRGKDSPITNSGTYIIEAVEYGMKGEDAVEVNGGKIIITSGSDGIQSNNDTEEDKGYIRVTGGAVTITAGKKGILTETLVGVIDGIIDIDARDDSIHSGKDVGITTDQLTLSMGDDAVHGNNLVEVSGGIIAVEQGSEGVKGLCVEITGGTTRISSEDNGINAAGKKGKSPAADTLTFENSFGNRRGQDDDSFGVAEGTYIHISDGDMKINASGDGIDSNGDLYLEGRAVLVEDPAGGGNGALGYGEEGSMSGGIILAVGSAGIFRTLSEESPQSILVVYFNEIRAAGPTISMKDGQGNQLTEAKVSKTSEALLFSSPELKTGEIYYMEAGDQDAQVVANSILNQYGGSSDNGSGRVPGDGSGDFEKKPGAGNISGKASIVEIQEALLAEALPEGIRILGSRGNVE